jgi:uncharacterized protein YjiK
MLPLPYSKNSLPDTIDNTAFIKQLIETEIDEVNIEGVASTKEAIIFANRANIKNPINHLIFTASSFPDTAASSSTIIRKLILPNNKYVAGVSGLAYDAGNDLLLFTASTEATEVLMMMEKSEIVISVISKTFQRKIRKSLYRMVLSI